MPSYWSAKDERMYQHVLSSSGDKHIAAATVNKHRRAAGRTKSKMKRRRH